MEKLKKKLQETKSLLHKERLKEKLGKEDFLYDMEEVFEPVTTKQVEATAKQIEAEEKQIQIPKSNYRHYVIPHWLFKKVATHCENQLKKEYKNMMKLRIAIIEFLRVLLIPTKLILVF